MKRRIIAIGCMFFIFSAVVLFGVPQANAAPTATFTVNQTADLADAAIGDGHCDTNASSSGDQCSLRAAVQEANFTRLADTIKFVSSASHTLTRSGTDDNASLGDLDITQPLTIEGRLPNTTIDGGQIDRVFHVLSGNVTFKNLIIRGGRLVAATSDGAVSVGVQGVAGNLTFNNVTLADNQVQQALSDTGCCAGASDISCACSVTVTNSFLTSTNDKGIIANQLTLTDSFVLNHNNIAITVSSGTSTLTRAIIRGNRGGVTNKGGTLLIQNSEISNGIPGIDIQPPLLRGNGVWNDGATAATKIVNSTISNNHSLGGGGGIFNIDGTVNLFNVTITGNTTQVDSLHPEAGGGGILNQNGTVTLTNTIVANNSDAASTAKPDCAGSFISGGFNLIGNTDGCTIAGTLTGNLLNVNPVLGALANNGGPTLTHALLANSPAIDAGNPSGCPSEKSENLTTDQRGSLRPTDGNGDLTPRCDIGAFEAGAVGIGAIAPNHGSSAAGALQVFDVAWDSPTRWRDLNTVDLRFKGTDGKLLWLRFTEGLPKSSFALLDRKGNVIDSGNAGDAKVLKNKFGALDVSQSGFIASGPNDPHVVLHFAVTFKQSALGKWKMQMLATDDFASAQGPEPGGVWRVK